MQSSRSGEKKREVNVIDTLDFEKNTQKGMIHLIHGAYIFLSMWSFFGVEIYVQNGPNIGNLME